MNGIQYPREFDNKNHLKRKSPDCIVVHCIANVEWSDGFLQNIKRKIECPT